MVKQKMLVKKAYEFLGVNNDTAEMFANDFIEIHSEDELQRLSVDKIVSMVCKQIEVDLMEEFLDAGHADDVYRKYGELTAIEFEIGNGLDYLNLLTDKFTSICEELVGLGCEYTVSDIAKEHGFSSDLECMFKLKEESLGHKIDTIGELEDFINKEVYNYLNQYVVHYNWLSVITEIVNDRLNIKISYIDDIDDEEKVLQSLKGKYSEIGDIREAVTSVGGQNAYLWYNRGDICTRLVFNDWYVDILLSSGDKLFYSNEDSIIPTDKMLETLEPLKF